MVEGRETWVGGWGGGGGAEVCVCEGGGGRLSPPPKAELLRAECVHQPLTRTRSRVESTTYNQLSSHRSELRNTAL